MGDVINKIKLRGSMLCSAVLFSGGFLILGFMTELWQVYVAYIVMGIGSALGGGRGRGPGRIAGQHVRGGKRADEQQPQQPDGAQKRLPEP